MHMFKALDIRPQGGGEYWTPRGVKELLSGFVQTKESGLRILSMVKAVTHKENPESHLDCPEGESNWIQFKFSPNEFDIVKLYNFTKGQQIITKSIIEECVLKGE